MEKSKKFRMPAGIRNKLMAAIAMLLVSSIMMVSSTYAWFTLSTAPEVTGITTSVGANGNLEMALLNTNTYGDLTAISSAVGSSSATAAVTDANITWGNLVDLSDASYGLQTINLQPARLNLAAGHSQLLASATSLLQMPIYGKDGRVAELSSDTYSTTYTDNSWAFDTDNQQYGVRAIGSNDNLTPQQAGLMAAKVAYNNNLNSAKSAVQGALSTNGNALASALTALSIDADGELEDDQIAAVNAMISASASALNYIDAAYKQALLAYTASQVSDAIAYSTAVSTINEAASFSAAVDALDDLADVTVTPPSELTGAVTELETQRGNVTAAQQAFALDTAQGYKDALSKLVKTDMVTINGFASSAIRNDDGSINSAFTSAIINDGGAVVAMPDGSGVFAYVGSVAGNYSANCTVDIKYGDTQMSDIKATMRTTATVNPVVATAINTLQAAASSGEANTVLSDLYGYALDFAFRTNAAESYLQLQTEGAQRVYSDSTSAATMGAGSTMTFQTTTTDAGTPTLTNDQVKGLMEAIRVAFVNPDNSEVYGIAALNDIAENSEGFTGKLYLQTYSVDPVSGVMTVSGKKVDGANAETDPKEAADTIMKLNQSQAAKLTVVVWLDGDMVDNADVANAAQSLIGSMNLQFASSAELIPMQNTALQNMTITYTELDNAEYDAGLYTFNGVLCEVNNGYKIYTGSDSSVYFSNDETNYTKLTVMSQNTALSPVTVSVTADQNTVTEGEELALTLEASAGTVKTVTWSSDAEAVATVTGDTDGATVSGVDAGTAKITAAVALEFSAEVTHNVSVDFTVTVTEPAAAEPEAPVTYTVTEEVEGLAVSPIVNEAGDTVTITAESGYTLSNVVVTGASGNVDVTTLTEGSEYTFTMPAEAVVVTADATANP